MRSQRGFTLLEILVAIAIFTFVAAAAMSTMANSDEMAASGRRARDLRMLAELRLGEVLAFDKHWDEQAPYEGDFSDLFPEMPEWHERFKDWKWQLEIRGKPGTTLMVFGVSTDGDAEYLFGAPTDEDKDQALQDQQKSGGTQPGGQGAGGTTGGTTPGGGSGGGAQHTPQDLREITVRVSAPAEDGGDSVELITFAPVIGDQPQNGAQAR